MDSVVSEKTSLSIRFAFYVVFTLGFAVILFNVISINKLIAPFLYRVDPSVQECPLVSQKLSKSNHLNTN